MLASTAQSGGSAKDSFARAATFTSKAEGAINEQINIEYNISYGGWVGCSVETQHASGLVEGDVWFFLKEVAARCRSLRRQSPCRPPALRAGTREAARR